MKKGGNEEMDLVSKVKASYSYLGILLGLKTFERSKQGFRLELARGCGRLGRSPEPV